MYFRRNVMSYHEKRYLQNCNYNRDNDPLCPIFRLEDVVSEANANTGDPDATYDSIAVKVEPTG